MLALEATTVRGLNCLAPSWLRTVNWESRVPLGAALSFGAYPRRRGVISKIEGTATGRRGHLEELDRTGRGLDPRGLGC
jgi:hypothetical protein